MKKKLCIFASALCIGISVYATVEFKTTCGYVGHTVNQEYFESKQEYQEYVNSLNEIYCGEKGDVKIIRAESFKTVK